MDVYDEVDRRETDAGNFSRSSLLSRENLCTGSSSQWASLMSILLRFFLGLF